MNTAQALNCNLALSSSDIIAACALFIAALAFVATVWQGAIARTHARLSVRPHLDTFESRTSTERLEVGIVNNGLGPAIICQLSAGLLGESPGEQRDAYAQRLTTEAKTFTEDCSFKMVARETPLLPGQKIALISLTVDIDDQKKLKAAIAFLNGFNFQVKYRSIYEEEFTLAHLPK